MHEFIFLNYLSFVPFRLRVTLSAVHTMDDLKKLTTTLSQCIDFKDIGIQISNKYAKL